MGRLIGDVIRETKPELLKRDHINKEEWRSILCVKVTADRRLASNYWDLLVGLGIFKPINGKAYRIDEDAMIAVLGTTNGMKQEAST